MDATSTVGVKGRVRIRAHDIGTGRLVAERNVDNLVVLSGRNLIRDLLLNLSSARITHFAVGTSGTAVVAGDTTLGAEVLRQDITQETANAGAIFVRHYLSSTSANGSSLAEAGLFTAASGGIMFARTTYTPIAKNSSIGITYEWTITIGAS